MLRALLVGAASVRLRFVVMSRSVRTLVALLVAAGALTGCVPGPAEEALRATTAAPRAPTSSATPVAPSSTPAPVASPDQAVSPRPSMVHHVDAAAGFSVVLPARWMLVTPRGTDVVLQAENVSRFYRGATLFVT